MRPFRVGRIGQRSPGPRRLTLLFIAVLLPPALTLVWLGATLLDQDRSMLAERGRERREAAAEIITRALLQSVIEAERWLVEDDIPDGAVRMTRTAAGVGVYPAGRVFWMPDVPERREAANEPFAEAERAEFDGTGDRGLARYESLSRSSDAAIRAGAFLRIARAAPPTRADGSRDPRVPRSRRDSGRRHPSHAGRSRRSPDDVRDSRRRGPQGRPRPRGGSTQPGSPGPALVAGSGRVGAGGRGRGEMDGPPTCRR